MYLLTLAFWQAALIRAGRTALIVAVPYFGAVKFADIPWIVVASAVGFAFVASLLTSLADVPEASGATVSWWYALIERIGKTFAQTLLAGFGTALLFSDVDWGLVLQSAGIAALGSLVLALVGKLPEAPVAPQQAGTVVPLQLYAAQPTRPNRFAA